MLATSKRATCWWSTTPRCFRPACTATKKKTGAKIEVFLLRELNKEMNLWDVLVDPARKIRVGNKLFFGEGELVAEVIDNTTSRGTHHSVFVRGHRRGVL